MTITKFEDTIIPQTPEGQAYANTFEKLLRELGAFNGRKEDTQGICIKAFYRIEVNNNES